jgi:hypothetical protein
MFNMKRTPTILAFLAISLLPLMAAWFVSCTLSEQKYRVTDVSDISYVPASFPVGFSLLTHGDHQFVAYYDSAKNMTIASRKLNDKLWNYKVLDSKIGWDSHNYVVMKIDARGYLHVSGNMHVNPLVYFISTNPLDIQSLTRVGKMIGREEDKVTYPAFMDGPNGEFLFHYRYGSSGNGYEVYNSWDVETQTWTRYLDKPLIDGENQRNAYMQGPMLGPDNLYHMVWVWRDTPDCATNHTLSYARSRDLLHWESIRGEKVDIPITISEKTLYVDETPPGGGLLNPNIRLSFDSSGNVIIGYHKYDKDMFTQLFISRYENGHWTNRQITQWNLKWIFQGGGSIQGKLSIAVPQVLPNGNVSFGYERKDISQGRRQVILDGKTLHPIKEESSMKKFPDIFYSTESNFPEMTVKTSTDLGKSLSNGAIYMLRWETLPSNRDVKPKGELPPPSMLRLYKLNK